MIAKISQDIVIQIKVAQENEVPTHVFHTFGAKKNVLCINKIYFLLWQDSRSKHATLLDEVNSSSQLVFPVLF